MGCKVIKSKRFLTFVKAPRPLSRGAYFIVGNNLLGGSEDAQAAWIRQHGVDMATCSDNPTGPACQKAKNERDAAGLALATGSVALLPGGAQAMWGLGAGVNAGAQYAEDGKVNPVNSIVAGWINVASMGNDLWGTVGWNAAGGALTKKHDKENSLNPCQIKPVLMRKKTAVQ